MAVYLENNFALNSLFLGYDIKIYLILGEIMNLDDFISMSPKIGEGCVKDIDGFVKYFENDVTTKR